MPLTNHQILTAALPFLRRYSRALTGNQKAADSLVLATIQGVSQSHIFTLGDFRRLDLYRCFTQILNSQLSIGSKAATTAEQTSSKTEQRLLAIPKLERQAFLLSAVEGFNKYQITEILDITQEKLAILNAEAMNCILEQVATDVLIIEDELFIATELEDILTSLGHHVIAIERTHADAVRAIRFAKPGLILADIHLADGSSGIEAANEILLDGEVPVVFITAYPERLLTGFRPEPTFLLTKPFKVEGVRAVVSQALFFETRARSGIRPAQRPTTIGWQ